MLPEFAERKLALARGVLDSKDFVPSAGLENSPLKLRNSKSKPKYSYITMVLANLGFMFLGIGFVCILLLVLLLEPLLMADEFGPAGVSMYQMLIAVPFFALLFLTFGAICLGIRKAIRILEEIRASI